MWAYTNRLQQTVTFLADLNLMIDNLNLARVLGDGQPLQFQNATICYFQICSSSEFMHH